MKLCLSTKTATGEPCKRKVKEGGRCWAHKNEAQRFVVQVPASSSGINTLSPTWDSTGYSTVKTIKTKEPELSIWSRVRNWFSSKRTQSPANESI